MSSLLLPTGKKVDDCQWTITGFPVEKKQLIARLSSNTSLIYVLEFWSDMQITTPLAEVVLNYRRCAKLTKKNCRNLRLTVIS